MLQLSDVDPIKSDSEGPLVWRIKHLDCIAVGALLTTALFSSPINDKQKQT